MAKDNQQPDKNSEDGFFEQNDYQQNVGAVTFGLRNPVNKNLTPKDLEDINTLAPLSFIQHKFKSDKDYQLGDRYTPLDEESYQFDGSEGKNLFEASQLPGVEPTSEATEEENDNLYYNLPEPGEEGALSDDTSLEQQEDLTNLEGTPEKLADEIEPDDRSDAQDSNINSDGFSALADELKKSSDTFDENDESAPTTLDEPSPPEDTKSNNSTNQESITLSSDELNALTGGDIGDEPIDNTVPEAAQPEQPDKEEAETTTPNEINSIANEQDNTVPENSNIDEQLLYSSFDQSLNSSVDEKYKKKLLETKLANYRPENRDLILQSIQHRKIDTDQINNLIDLVLKNTSETLVVETLNQQLFKKTGYEIFERRDREQKQEARALETSYSSYQRKRFLAGITIISTFVLFLILSVYFSYESILTYRLYQKAIAAAEEEQYQDAELFFDEAYQLQPQINPSIELAEIYLKKNQLELAKDKYDKLFISFPDSSEVLVANSRFYRIINDFARSKTLISLGESKFPQDILLLQEKAEVLLEEGFTFKDYVQAQENWLMAEKIFADLLLKYPDNQEFFLQRRLELAAIQKDFFKSSSYYNIIQGLDTTYDLRSMSRYLAFLIETQEHIGDSFYPIKPEPLSGIQNSFAISTIDQIIMQLDATYPNHYLVNIEKARWAHRKKDFVEASQLIDASIDAIRKEQNFLINEDLVYALNTAGILNIRQEEVIPALEYFQQSLTIEPNNYLANYYAGKIHLTSLNQVKTAKEFFTLSYENWFNPNDRRYADTHYSLGYINFLEGKAEANPENQELYFKNSVVHWSELLRNKLPEKNYLIVFNLATTYLYLKEYELAQIFFESNLEELKPIFQYYQERSDRWIRESAKQKNELELLSDVFNNLAVAQIKAQTESISPGTEIPGVTIEHLINSITLKDQLGVMKGVPYVNFNTINDYPKYSASFAAKRPLLIGDSFIPSSMFEKTF